MGKEICVIIEKMVDDAFFPEYKTDGASGADLAAYLSEDVEILPGEFKMIPTAIRIELPFGVEAQVRSRSGLASKFGVFVLNSPGTVDSDYRGEMKVVLFNAGKDPFVVTHGMRVAQMCLQTVLRGTFVEGSLSETARGSGGFGHTGLLSSHVVGDS